jgi:hypothetical protein
LRVSQRMTSHEIGWPLCALHAQTPQKGLACTLQRNAFRSFMDQPNHFRLSTRSQPLKAGRDHQGEIIVLALQARVIPHFCEGKHCSFSIRSSINIPISSYYISAKWLRLLFYSSASSIMALIIHKAIYLYLLFT